MSSVTGQDPNVNPQTAVTKENKLPDKSNQMYDTASNNATKKKPTVQRVAHEEMPVI